MKWGALAPAQARSDTLLEEASHEVLHLRATAQARLSRRGMNARLRKWINARRGYHVTELISKRAHPDGCAPP